MNTAKEDDVTTLSRMAFRINMEFCDQTLNQQILYQIVNQGWRVFEFSGSLSTGTKVLDLRPAILAIKASTSDLSIFLFTT